MSAYATKQAFAGQRASVGRIVLLATFIEEDAGPRISAGVVVVIDDEKDEPCIVDLDFAESDGSDRWTFRATTTEADVTALPAGSWTWPPRIT